MSTINTARSTSLESNQLCQIGLTNSGSTNTLISTYGSTFVQNYVASKTSSGRKKRQTTYTFTCDDLNTMSTGVTSLTSSQLQTLTGTEFYKCQTLLGSSSNSWSSAQLSVLASTAKTFYTSASAISDKNITALNSIMVGFSSSDLAILTFTTTTSIGALGALNGWSSDQLNSLATPLTNYVTNYLSGTITSDFLTSAANLLCSLTSGQITGITESVFTSSVSALAKISLTCPNMNSWYAKAKISSTYGATLVSDNSKLTELGSILTGITTTDIASVPADSISSISTTAWKYMPAATVNSLSSDQLNGLSNDQLTSLLNSPNYSSFSGPITSALSSLSGSSSAKSGAINFNANLVLLIGLQTFLFFYLFKCN